MESFVQTSGGRLKSILKFEVFGIFFAMLGVLLRLRQYIANRSLWHDEANLALNLVNRSFSGLTRPLDYEQGAPVGFLFIEKSFMVVMGNRDFILRLFPLICGLVILYLVYRIAKEYFGAAGLVAVLLVSISWPLVYYSSELKQYSSDALLAALLIYLSFRCLEESARLKDFLWLGVAGVIAIWISHPAIFILAGIGPVLLLRKLAVKNYPHLFWTFGLGLAWLVSFGIEYQVSLRHLIANPFLQNYWLHDYMPLPPWQHLDWLFKTYQTILYLGLNPDFFYGVFMSSLLILIGIFALFKRNPSMAIILLAPFAMALSASALQKYPLDERLMLFLTPEIVFLIAEGFGFIFSLLKQTNQSLAWLVTWGLALVFLWAPTANAYQHFLTPDLHDDIKPVLLYIAEKKAPADLIYVYHGARSAFSYYAASYGLSSTIPIKGADFNGRTTPKAFIDDLKLLPVNRRVWFIFSHVDDCNGCEGDAETFLIPFLNQSGSVVDSFHATNADAYLYLLHR